MLLHLRGCLVAQHANVLVGLLARGAFGDRGHEEALGAHEGELGRYARCNYLPGVRTTFQLTGSERRDYRRIHHESAGDVIEEYETCVSGEEAGRQVDSSYSRVVERAFEPLRLVGV